MPPAASQLKNRLILAQVTTWDVESVCRWLDSIGIPEAQGQFRKEKLDGKNIIKLSPKEVVSKLRGLKKQHKETLTLYLEDMIENVRTSVNTLKCPVPSAAPAPVMNSPGRSAAEAATDDEFDDDEWDEEDEIYANENQPSAATAAGPAIPDRNQQPGRQPLRSANQPPPPPIRSPTTHLGSSETTSDDEYVAPTSVAPPVSSAMTSSRPAPPPPVDSCDELYEAPDANDDDTYEATETYVENKQMPSQMAPGRPSQPHVPVLPPRGGPAVPQPGAKQSLPSRAPALPTDDEVYEEPEPTPPTPKRSVPMAPTLDDVYQVTDSEEPPAALPDRRHQPVPPVPVPMPSSGITGRPVPPPPSTPVQKHSVPSPMSPGRPSAGRPVPPPPAPASNDEIYEETDDVIAAPPPPSRGRPAPPPPPADQPSDDICYEATDDYQENKLPAYKAGSRPPALPPAARPPIPAPQDNHDVSDGDIYEETDDMKPALPASGPRRPPMAQPDKQMTAPVLPSRHVPAAPDHEEVYEETDDLSEDYTVPDPVPPPPPPPATRAMPGSRKHSTSDEQCANFNDTTSRSGPPRKPPPLPDAQIPVDDTAQGARIPAGVAPFGKMMGDKTVKEMRGKLRPVVVPNESRAAPGGPPCVDVDQQQAPGAPWAGQLKRRTSSTNSAVSHPVPQPIPPPVVNLKTVTPNPRTKPQPQPPSPVAISAPDNERPSPKSSFKKADPLDKFSWYFGNIHRDIAKQKVADMKMEGAFIVRKSENGGPEYPFTLTVLHNSEVFNIQLRLRAEDSKFALGKPKPKETVHSTIEDLVRFHENNEIEVTKQSGPCGGVKLVSSPPK